MKKDNFSSRWVRMIERQMKWSFWGIIAIVGIVIIANQIW